MSRQNVLDGASAPPSATKELIVLACYPNFFRCRERGPNGRFVTFKTKNENEVPGAIITVNPTEEITSRGKDLEISGTIASSRYCAKDLGLVPVPIVQRDKWSPKEAGYGENGELLPDWFKPIAKRGKRPMLLFEPDGPIGGDPKNNAANRKKKEPSPLELYELAFAIAESIKEDPIMKVYELMEIGNNKAARKILMDLLAKDLSLIEAHCILGGMEFENNPQKALLHCQMGYLIGMLSLENQIPDPVLPWTWDDNRPFLRCLCTLGICAWKSKNLLAAKDIFLKILSYNPNDNQGVRFMLPFIDKGKSYDDFDLDQRLQGNVY